MMSRQFVTHGHVFVNGKKMTIPSYTVQKGDVVNMDAKILKNPDVIKVLEENKELLGFLEKKGPVGKLVRMPVAEDIQVPFSTRQIIEYYSR
jgi:small subunit ribosomal protein S4